MANDLWQTPDYLLEAARATLGRIDLDPASSADANERVKATAYYTEQCSGLYRPWHMQLYATDTAYGASRVWLNPPYSRGNVARFTDKLIAEYDANNVHSALMLVNSDTGTKWAHRLLGRFPVCFLHRRVAFVDPATGEQIKGNDRPQAVFYAGAGITRFAAVWADLGVVMAKVQPATDGQPDDLPEKYI